MSSPQAFNPPALDNTMGAALIGLLVTITLYGVACLQIFSYYRTYKDDKIGLKVLVFIILILETLHTIIVSHSMYFYLVRNFGNYIALNTAVWSIIVPLGLSCLIGTIVQCFFAWRIWLVSNKNWILSAFICVFSFAQLGIGLALMTIGFSLREFSRLVGYKGIVTSTLVNATVADILIASSLCYYLNSRRTGFSTTDDAINTLIIFAINNGLVTSMVSIADFTTVGFCLPPSKKMNILRCDTPVFGHANKSRKFCVIFHPGKRYVPSRPSFLFLYGYLNTNGLALEVYSNSLLSTLNSREYLRKQRDVRGGRFALELSSINNNSTPGMGAKSLNAITISSNSV